MDAINQIRPWLPATCPRTPGAWLYWLRDKFGHGLRVAYYRDVVRPRILQAAPIRNTTDDTAEIHVLTSAGDWLNLLWTLKSFYAVSPKRYALCIHADKTLPDDAIAALHVHFPNARIIPRHEADLRIAELLKPYPRCLEFRKENLLAPKVFDFIAYLECDRVLLFDSDLLFFAAPEAFLRRVEDPHFQKNAFNSDAEDSAYTTTPEIAREHLDLQLHPRINSGLGIVHPESMRLDWLEEFLGLPGVREGHFWRIEQTLYALCASRFGVELLPVEYTLYFTPGLHGRPFRHYNGAIRHLMYSEGMRELTRAGLLA